MSRDDILFSVFGFILLWFGVLLTIAEGKIAKLEKRMNEVEKKTG